MSATNCLRFRTWNTRYHVPQALPAPEAVVLCMRGAPLGDIGELWRSGRLRFRMTRLLSKCRPGRRDASLDAVAFALAPEGCRVDTQARRRLFEGRGFGKGLLDVAAFKVFE
jgi:hypothetical protein